MTVQHNSLLGSLQMTGKVDMNLLESNMDSATDTVDREIFTLKIICVKIFMLINFRGSFHL